MTANSALSARNVSKTFESRTVLTKANLEIAPGEIHGLVGANGSGKSTLIKVLAGYHTPDPGAEIAVGGRPRDASERARHIRFVHQDLGLVPTLTIAENFGLGESASLRTVRDRTNAARCRARLDRFDLPYRPNTLVGDLSMTEQVMVAVVRAVTASMDDVALLVLDEATSGLPTEEAEEVARIVRRAAADDLGVLFISHRLDEVLELCDRVTVLRDGHMVRNRPSAEYDTKSLAADMFGPAAEAVPSERAERADERVVRLAVDGLTGKGLDDVTFDVAEGEIVGITGLLNCGSTELGRTLFGMDRPKSGQVQVDGRPVRSLSPAAAIEAGLAYVPASRDLSLLKALPVRENITLTDRGVHWRRGRIATGAEKHEVRGLLERFHVRPVDTDAIMGTFSGGNQQKMALAKWLRCRPRVLVLDEPCRGVDIAARQEIYRLLRQAADDGLAILILTTEVEEVALVCDRALIMRDGAITAELGSDRLQPNVLLAAVTGEEAA